MSKDDRDLMKSIIQPNYMHQIAQDQDASSFNLDQFKKIVNYESQFVFIQGYLTRMKQMT